MPPPRIPFAPPPANFRNLANLEGAFEKMQWCFQVRPFWQAKLLRVIKTYHLTHVLISIFIVFLLRTDRISWSFLDPNIWGLSRGGARILVRGKHRTKFHTWIPLSPVLQWRRQNFSSGGTLSKNVLIKDFWKISTKL